MPIRTQIDLSVQSKDASLSTQKIQDAAITESKIAAAAVTDLSIHAVGGTYAGIATTKLADGPLFIQSNGSVPMGATLSMGGFGIAFLGAPNVGTDAANKDYVDNLISGLSWKPSVLFDQFIGNTASAPFVATDGDTYFDTTLQDYVFYNEGTATWTPTGYGPQQNGDRVIVDFASGETIVGGGVHGHENEIATWNGSSWGSFYAPVNGDTVLVHGGHGAQTAWTFNGSNWVQISGAGTYLAGVGLTLTGGNVFSVLLGAGIKDLPTGEVGIDLAVGGGLTLSNETANGQVEVAFDNLTIGVNGVNSLLEVKNGSITSTQLATSVNNDIASGVSAASHLGNYLPLVGGTLTGDLNVAGHTVTAGDFVGNGAAITGVVHTETDPVFVASVAHGITSGDITNWNGKVNKAGDTMTGNLSIKTSYPQLSIFDSDAPTAPLLTVGAIDALGAEAISANITTEDGNVWTRQVDGGGAVMLVLNGTIAGPDFTTVLFQGLVPGVAGSTGIPANLISMGVTLGAHPSRIGINSNANNKGLSVQGGVSTDTLQISTGAQTGYVLTSDDGLGNASWQSIVIPSVPVSSVDGRTGAVILSDLYTPLSQGITSGQTASWNYIAANGVTLGQTGPWNFVASEVGIIVVRDAPVGVTGVTGAYDFSHQAMNNTEEVYLNGQLQEPFGEDYTVSIEGGLTRITFVTQPPNGSRIRATYRY